MKHLVLLMLVGGLAACSRQPISVASDGGALLPVKCTNWTRLASSPMPDSFRGVLGFGPQDVYAVVEKTPIGTAAVDGEVLHYDGVNTTSMTTLSGRPLAIWGSSPSDIYVLHGSLHTYSATSPNSPYITHFDGKTWTKQTHAPAIGGYSAVWGTGPNDVYVVGGERYNAKGAGAVLHFDGASWSVVYKVGARFAFDAVWGSGPHDVFVSGCCDANNDGGIYHYDGTSWDRSFSRPWTTFESIWGSGPSDVFAAGKLGVYRYDGARWKRQALPWHEATISPLDTVWGSSGSRVFAGGVLTMLSWDGQAWSLVDKPPGSFNYETHYVYDMWGSGSTLFVAGAEWGGPGALWRGTCTQ